MSKVTASAPGKINIFFAVGPLGADGFHDVFSIYQALNLREEISVTSASEWSVEVSGQLSEAQLSAVPTGEENLVVRAAKVVAAAAEMQQPHPVKFEITKNVPVAGGMGGGSADAAAALMAIDELWCTGVEGDDLLKAAAELGADVPFALLGGTAIGTGKGHELVPLDSVNRLHWVLVANQKGLSTPSVYKRLDELRSARGQDPTKVPTPTAPKELLVALLSGDPQLVAPLLHNDLQEAALDLMPELSETIANGLTAGALAAMVSGSGPTIALLAQDSAAASVIASQLAAQGHTAIATFGPAAGTILEKS
jgi:4-diphosphocytidyl-2-C-methyl-D-erythritol kinase